MTNASGMQKDLEGKELWRRQHARNLMDCYALGMEALNGVPVGGSPGHKAFEELARLMVEGMTSVRSVEDEAAFYRMAAGLCRECAEADLKSGDGSKAGLFRVYTALFEDLGRKEG